MAITRSGFDALTPLTGRAAISAGLAQIRSAIRNYPDATRHTHILGAQGGSGESKLTWFPNLGFWVCVEPYEAGVRSRHWLAYGLVDPSTTSANLDIRVETALPHRGINRRIAGLLAQDGLGNVYLLHSGKIGGGKKGFGKTYFWKHYRGDRAHVDFADGNREYALIGRTDASDFIARLGHFVRGIDALRGGNPNYAWRFPTGSGLRPFVTKGGGKSKAELTKTIIIRNQAHDEVLNALRIALAGHASVASIDEDIRDLHLKLTDGSEVNVEVKTRTDRYEIYTAVGQLLLNRDRSKLVLVAPRRLADATDLIRRLHDLAITFVGYERSGKRVTFSALDALLGSRASSKPTDPNCPTHEQAIATSRYTKSRRRPAGGS